MKRFLYSKWFFLMLAAVCVLDMVADWGERVWGWRALHLTAVALDAVAAGLALWMFGDLHKRRPRRKHGDDTGG
jgi:hypothetical protein